jgi:hypothetical protein
MPVVPPATITILEAMAYSWQPDHDSVTRTVHPLVPPSVEYGLTDRGRSLLVPVSALADWAVEHA